MPGAKEAAVDDGGIGDTSGTAALDDDRGSAEDEHYINIENEDLSNFKIKSDSHGVLCVEEKDFLETSDTFKKGDPVMFNSLRQHKYWDEIQEYSRSPSLEFVPASKSGLTITEEDQIIDFGRVAQSDVDAETPRRRGLYGHHACPVNYSSRDLWSHGRIRE